MVGAKHVGDATHVSLDACDGSIAECDTVDACFALIVRMLRQLTQTVVMPDRVELRRVAAHEDVRHREMPGAVTFASARDELVFDGETPATHPSRRPTP